MKPLSPTTTTLAVLLLLTGVLPAMAAAAEADTARAAWLLERGADTGAGFMETRHFQAEVGGSGISAETSIESPSSHQGSVGLKMLASAVLPGTGEVLLGHKHGFILMAADILAWTQVFKYNSEGEDKADEYYAFADAHYTDELLIEGYFNGSVDIERSGEGPLYFPDFDEINSRDLDELEKLPLYVTKEEDRREYYENLGKWDQFIFGWDDYQRASEARPEYDYEPTEGISDLRQPWVSKNRATYRTMREESNDAYEKSDRWLYVNIGLRVFSILETAWLGGLLGGSDDSMAVAGHRVQLVTAPEGPDRGRVGAKVWF